MVRKAALVLIILLLVLSCSVSFDGSTAIQEVFAERLYSEAVYLDNGGLTLIISQDKSVLPLDYYEVTFSKIDGEEIKAKVDYESAFDIILPYAIERGIYTITVKGYSGDEEVCLGVEEDYVLKGEYETLLISAVGKGHTHTIVWKNDETYHWKGCKDCSYSVDGTKAEHSFTLVDGDEYYCECGRMKPSEKSSSGFSAKEGHSEPEGHFTGTKSGNTWIFTFIDENPDYPSTVVTWFLDNREIGMEGDKTTLEVDIATYQRSLVLCVYKNDAGYGSYEVMVDGTWNQI